MFSIVLSALLAHSCLAEIVINPTGPQHLSRLYRAAIDIATTCYGDLGDAVGIIGDTDGSILKELRLNRFIPAVLADESNIQQEYSDTSGSHKLKVFIIGVHSPIQVMQSLKKLRLSIWWNTYGNFLLVDMRTKPTQQCSSFNNFLTYTTQSGLLKVQFICNLNKKSEALIVILNSNPFTRRAPDVWKFLREFESETKKYRERNFLFGRVYKEGGESCESINFAKTRNVGGFPIRFVTRLNPALYQRDFVFPKRLRERLGASDKVTKFVMKGHRWFMDNIVIALNASAVISNDSSALGINLLPRLLSSEPDKLQQYVHHMILSGTQTPMFAITQHTGHMTQLDKILSVIDRTSRIGMWVVYFITFLFFKFFLGQAAMPALLNLVRLTCNTGLTTLPQNVAPTIFLASLFMFVVTLQGIYTGNLATLLTTTMPYPNVQMKADIANMGYTLYNRNNSNTKLTADPTLDGRVIEIPISENCIKYVLPDPLGVCCTTYQGAIIDAEKFKLHVSRNPIMHDYLFYVTTGPNLFKRRVEEVLITLFEGGLHPSDPSIERLRLQFVYDDEVKKNTHHRVMTFDDLRFAFMILAIGLLCSLICFIGEIVICRIRLKYAKRRGRVRVRTAWGVTAKKCSLLPSLNCRFNLRR